MGQIPLLPLSPLFLSHPHSLSLPPLLLYVRYRRGREASKLASRIHDAAKGTRRGHPTDSSSSGISSPARDGGERERDHGERGSGDPSAAAWRALRTHVLALLDSGYRPVEVFALFAGQPAASGRNGGGGGGRGLGAGGPELDVAAVQRGAREVGLGLSRAEAR